MQFSQSGRGYIVSFFENLIKMAKACIAYRFGNFFKPYACENNVIIRFVKAKMHNIVMDIGVKVFFHQSCKLTLAIV